MRRLIGLSAMAIAATTVAQPAFAADSALGLTQLIVSTGLAPAAPASATGGMLSVRSLETVIAPAAQAAAPDFRLHASVETTTVPTLADSQTGRLRRGFGAAMMDFFPLGSDGFHISGGSRFYNRMARPNADSPYAQLLYAPRAALSRASRRMTPALTLGYTKLVQQGLSLGIEGGAMLGKFDTLAGSLVRPPRLRGDGDGMGRLNQIARMTFGYHF